jgi:predicted nucleic acid-binding protein
VIPDSALVVLDTNVLVALVRNNPLGQRIGATLGLRERAERPLISIVSVGESLGLARQFGWEESKVDRLRQLLTALVVVDVSRPGVTDRYAEITDHARRIGRTLSDNDRWIAATASVVSAWLVTTDKDFDPLDPAFLRRVWIDAQGDA